LRAWRRQAFVKGGNVTKETCIFVVGFLTLIANPAYAGTTSRLEGRVADDQGGPLAGVQITISSESLIGGPQSTITNDAGSFSFHFLLVGEYTVEATLVGYTPATAVAPVRLDRTASVTLRMVPVTFSSEIQVDADVPIVDPTRTNTGEVFGEAYLQGATIGSNGRDYLRIMDQAAGVVPGTPQEVFGGSWSENAYLVDGFNTTDATTGASATSFNFDAVEEASVLTGGLDAEFGYGTGGVLNVVTKSGGNRFSGTFDARYRDQRFNESGEHYDADENVSSNRILSATLGGPILRDRLWFFAAFQNTLSEYTPVGAPETEVGRKNEFLGKLTWAINAANRLTLKYSTTPVNIDYLGVEWWKASEGTHQAQASEPISQLELNSVLSDALLLTVGLGINRRHVSALPMINDIETNPEFDADSYLLFSNPGWVEIDERHRDHHRAKLSYFAGDTSGSHQLDAGLEYHKLRGRDTSFTPGGYGLQYFNNAYWEEDPWPDGDGDGLVDLLLYRDTPPETAREPLRNDGDGWSAFVQDQWRPVPQLTLRLGLRYDTMVHTNTAGETIADFAKWLPRLGVAWDVGGRGRHVLRAGWSRYMHPGVTNMGVFVPGITRGTEEYYGLDFLCGAWGICDRETAAGAIGPEFVHVDSDGDEHPFYLVNIASEIPAETVDTLGVGRLRVPYRDELILAYEARVAEETSLELSYVKKEYHDLIDETCNNNTWAWGDGPAPNLDDPSTWTDEDGCTGSVRTNIDGLERNYEALILRIASRARPWFHLVGSYTYSRTRGNSYWSHPKHGFGSGAFPGSDFDYFPTNFVNLDGNLASDIRHYVKLNGYFNFPLDFTLGIGAFYRSAGPLSVWADCFDMFFPSDSGLAELERLSIDYDEMLGYCQSPGSGWLALESQGSRRGADLWQFDLQLTKGFRIRDVRLVGIVSVFNVFSEETPMWFTQDPFNRLGWGAPTGWQEPRRYELGFRVEF
jgi:hypothetical protein